jgi:hypothetical protein
LDDFAPVSCPKGRGRTGADSFSVDSGGTGPLISLELSLQPRIQSTVVTSLDRPRQISAASFFLQGVSMPGTSRIPLRLLAASLALVVVASVADDTFARVKLITLPVRERVEIQLDHAELTLVEEERIVPLVKGANQIDFSWANTQIDPNSIVFRVLGPADGDDDKDGPSDKLDVKVASVSYPPDESALVWTVGASNSGSARVRISYILGNLNKSFNYRAVASHDEKTLDLSQYMRLKNFANEEFGGAGVWAGFGPRFSKPIGLNETVEMLIEKYRDVPIKKTYSCNPQEHEYLDRGQNKLRVPMHYVLKNDAKHNLGQAPLPFGKVRIFIEGGGENGAANTAFLGEDWGQFTPRDDEMRIYLGVAQDIVVKRTIDKNQAKRITGNLYDHEVVVKYEIENFKKQPVGLDLIENLRHVHNEVRRDTGRDIEWEFGDAQTLGDEPDPERSTHEKLVFHADLPAADEDGKAEKVVHKLHLILKNEW